jgi:hypothetical protein
MDDLLARARRALDKARAAGSDGHEAPALPDGRFAGIAGSAPAPGLIQIPMWCSVTARPFAAMAERQGDVLLILRNAIPSAGKTPSGGGETPFRLLGSFRLADGGWPGCPHCGAKSNGAHGLGMFWVCDLPGCHSAIHCPGDFRGMFRCACGKAEARSFYQVASVEVRGAAPSPRPETRPAPGARVVSDVAPPAPRLTFKQK